MKSIYKLYALISVSITFILLTLIAVYPMEFKDLVIAFYDQIVNSTPVLISDLSVPQIVMYNLIIVFCINIGLNLIIMLFSFLHKDQFNFKVVRLSLIINTIVLLSIFFLIKLILQLVVNLIQKFL